MISSSDIISLNIIPDSINIGIIKINFIVIDFILYKGKNKTGLYKIIYTI